MIGNDIVDFVQAAKESNWRRRGWLDKICIPKEQVLVHNANNPDRMVWLLWSMKEAAYKAHQRTLEHAPRYNPKSFVCFLSDATSDFCIGQAESQGCVYVAGYCYITKSVMTSDFVHTTACLLTFLVEKKIISRVIENPKTTAIFNSVKAHLPKEKSNNYQLRKDLLGIPQIFDRMKNTSFLISLSHHGRFGSYFLTL